MLTCDEVRDLGTELALGMLAPTQEPVVREHVIECDQHTEVVELLAAAQAMAFGAEERTPSDGLRERVLAHQPSSAQTVAPRRIPWWLLQSVAAVAVLVAIVAFVAIRQSGGADELYLKAFTTDTAIDVEVSFSLFNQPIDIAAPIP